MSLRTITLSLTPPIIANTVRYFKKNFKLGIYNPNNPVSPQNPDYLFDGSDSQLFKQLARECIHYFEWGCGKSTVWVAKNTDCNITSVDTSSEWLNTTRLEVGDRRIVQNHVDLGSLGGWGRPVGYSHMTKFSDYTTAISRLEGSPDLVLVDGRFRVCCFLNALLYCDVNTLIVFDDYTPRDYYHIVEQYAGKPWRVCGRQAIFRVHSTIDRKSISDTIKSFQYVMD